MTEWMNEYLEHDSLARLASHCQFDGLIGGIRLENDLKKSRAWLYNPVLPRKISLTHATLQRIFPYLTEPSTNQNGSSPGFPLVQCSQRKLIHFIEK